LGVKSGEATWVTKRAQDYSSIVLYCAWAIPRHWGRNAVRFFDRLLSSPLPLIKQNSPF